MSDFDYAGNLFGIDLSRKAGEAPVSSQKPKEKQAQPPVRMSAKKSAARPRRPEREPWAERMPNASADYIIPDEALYPDDDDDDFSR